jgi:hypothetical protein
MPFVPTILPALDAIRAIGGLLGLRVFTVKIRKRVWTGSRPGLGTSTDFDTTLTNQAADGSEQPVRARQLTRREAIASGGKYTDRDLKVGPMTPDYIASILAAGGWDDNTLDPNPTSSAVEILWILTTNDGESHGLPPTGIVCEKVGEDGQSSLHYYVFLRATGRQA